MLVPAALHPDPETARSWVEQELSRPEYHQSLLERLYGWVTEEWNRLQSAALNASPLSTAAAVVVVTLLVVLVVLVASRVRREPAGPIGPGGVLVDALVSADEHRQSAQAALEAGRPDDALVEAFRAIAARAVQRGVLEERPGLTAHELTVGLSPFFPEQAEALVDASGKFDLVFYGHEQATVDDARSVLELDDALRMARPARVPMSEPVGAVPS